VVALPLRHGLPALVARWRREMGATYVALHRGRCRGGGVLAGSGAAMLVTDLDEPVAGPRHHSTARRFLMFNGESAG
jgi:hypothetical protein